MYLKTNNRTGGTNLDCVLSQEGDENSFWMEELPVSSSRFQMETKRKYFERWLKLYKVCIKNIK